MTEDRLPLRDLLAMSMNFGFFRVLRASRACTLRQRLANRRWS
jgi:hypothetical protein